MLRGEWHKARRADVGLVPGAVATSAQALAQSHHRFAPQM